LRRRAKIPSRQDLHTLYAALFAQPSFSIFSRFFRVKPAGRGRLTMKKLRFIKSNTKPLENGSQAANQMFSAFPAIASAACHGS
jgi:hypothetical protein